MVINKQLQVNQSNASNKDKIEDAFCLLKWVVVVVVVDLSVESKRKGKRDRDRQRERDDNQPR